MQVVWWRVFLLLVPLRYLVLRTTRSIGTPARAKFIRSIGSSLVSLSVWVAPPVAGREQPAPMMYAALIAHVAAQGGCAAEIALGGAVTQRRKFADPGLARSTECDGLIQLFGAVSALVALVGVSAILRAELLVAGLHSAIGYHLLAFAHNAYSTREGLYLDWGKALGHGAVAALAVLAVLRPNAFAEYFALLRSSRVSRPVGELDDWEPQL
jgi:hypothetical protein